MRCGICLLVFVFLVGCGEVAARQTGEVDATTELVTLTVTGSGDGAGTVTSSPAGIDCGSTCTMTVPSGTVVRLTASPEGAARFGGWSGGGCEGTGDCEVTMTADTTVDAAFEDDGVLLTVNLSGVGTGTVTSDPAGIDCAGDCTQSYATGTSVTLTATGTDGSPFLGWSGGGCIGTSTCVVTMSEARTVDAAFGCGTGEAIFDYTGAGQVLTRPACVTSITVDVRGAAGGVAYFNAPIGTAALGGRVEATVPISASDVINVFVGAAGAASGANVPGPGGYNGGGAGNTTNSGDTQAGGGGGGASDIRRNGITLTDRIVVAGGAAGVASCSGAAQPGGLGGGLTGGTPTAGCGTIPTGGTQSAGGTAGFYSGYCTGEVGAFGDGGDGCSPTGAGGGGGGYYGGGGGAWSGGGGGSSYTVDTATSVTHTQGFQAGNGQVIIRW